MNTDSEVRSFAIWLLDHIHEYILLETKSELNMLSINAVYLAV